MTHFLLWSLCSDCLFLVQWGDKFLPHRVLLLISPFYLHACCQFTFSLKQHQDPCTCACTRIHTRTLSATHMKIRYCLHILQMRLQHHLQEMGEATAKYLRLYNPGDECNRPTFPNHREELLNIWGTETWPLELQM